VHSPQKPQDLHSRKTFPNRGYGINHNTRRNVFRKGGKLTGVMEVQIKLYLRKLIVDRINTGVISPSIFKKANHLNDSGLIRDILNGKYDIENGRLD